MPPQSDRNAPMPSPSVCASFLFAGRILLVSYPSYRFVKPPEETVMVLSRGTPKKWGFSTCRGGSRSSYVTVLAVGVR